MPLMTEPDPGVSSAHRLIVQNSSMFFALPASHLASSPPRVSISQPHSSSNGRFISPERASLDMPQSASWLFPVERLRPKHRAPNPKLHGNSKFQAPTWR